MREKVLTFLGRSEFWIVGSALAAFLVLTWVLRGGAGHRPSRARRTPMRPRAAIATGSWPASWSA